MDGAIKGKGPDLDCQRCVSRSMRDGTEDASPDPTRGNPLPLVTSAYSSHPPGRSTRTGLAVKRFEGSSPFASTEVVGNTTISQLGFLSSSARAGEEGMAFGRPDTDGQHTAVRPCESRSGVAAPW